MKIGAALAAAAVVLVAAAFAGVASPEPARSADAAPADRGGGITVTGTGGVTTVPDGAEFSFGVTSQGATATAALTANGAEMRRVLAALRRAGIVGDDLRTEQVSLYPRTAGDGQEIVGYSATNSVSVRIEDLARSGAIIDAAVGAGANQVAGPSLSRSDRDDVYRDALRAAYADARAKAEALAAASGLTLGRVTSVVEGGGAMAVPYAERAAGLAADTPIEPGTQEVQATVTVTFAAG